MKSTVKELSITHLKHGRLLSLKDIVMHKWKIKYQGLVINDARNANE